VRDCTPFTNAWIQSTSSLIALAREAQRDLLLHQDLSEDLETAVLRALERCWNNQDHFGELGERMVCEAGLMSTRSHTVFPRDPAVVYQRLADSPDDLPFDLHAAFSAALSTSAASKQSLITSDATAPLAEGSKGRVDSARKTLWDQPSGQGTQTSASPELTIRAIVEEGKMNVIIRLWYSLRQLMRNPSRLISSTASDPPDLMAELQESESLAAKASSTPPAAPVGEHKHNESGPDSVIEDITALNDDDSKLLDKMIHFAGADLLPSKPSCAQEHDPSTSDTRDISRSMKRVRGPGPNSLRVAFRFLNLVLRILVAEQSCLILIHRFLQYTELIRLLELPILLAAARCCLTESDHLFTWIGFSMAKGIPEESVSHMSRAPPKPSLLSQIQSVFPMLVETVRAKAEQRAASFARVRELKRIAASRYQSHPDHHPATRPTGSPSSSSNGCSQFIEDEELSQLVRQKKKEFALQTNTDGHDLSLFVEPDQGLEPESQNARDPQDVQDVRTPYYEEDPAMEPSNQAVDSAADQPIQDNLWDNLSADMVFYEDDDTDPTAFLRDLLSPHELQEKAAAFFSYQGNHVDPSVSFSIMQLSCPAFFDVQSRLGACGPIDPRLDRIVEAIRSYDEDVQRIRREWTYLLDLLREGNDTDTVAMIQTILNSTRFTQVFSRTSYDLIKNRSDLPSKPFEAKFSSTLHYLLELGTILPLPVVLSKGTSDMEASHALGPPGSPARVGHPAPRDDQEDSDSAPTSEASDADDSSLSELSSGAIGVVHWPFAKGIRPATFGIASNHASSIMLFLALIGAHLCELQNADSSSPATQHSLLLDEPLRQIMESHIISSVLKVLANQSRKHVLKRETSMSDEVSYMLNDSFDHYEAEVNSDILLSARSRLLGISFVSSLLAVEVGTTYYPVSFRTLAAWQSKQACSTDRNGFFNSLEDFMCFEALTSSIRNVSTDPETVGDDHGPYSSPSTLIVSHLALPATPVTSVTAAGRTQTPDKIDRPQARKQLDFGSTSERTLTAAQHLPPSYEEKPWVSTNQLNTNDDDEDDDEFDVYDYTVTTSSSSLLQPVKSKPSSPAATPSGQPHKAPTVLASSQDKIPTPHPSASLTNQTQPQHNISPVKPTSIVSPSNTSCNSNSVSTPSPVYHNPVTNPPKPNGVTLARFHSLAFLQRLPRFLDYIRLSLRRITTTGSNPTTPSKPTSLPSNPASPSADQPAQVASARSLSVLERVRAAGAQYFGPSR